MQVLKTIGEHRAVRRIQAEVLRLATDDDGMSTAEYAIGTVAAADTIDFNTLQLVPNREIGLPLLRRPRHSGALNIAYVGRNLTLNLDGIFVGRRRDGDPVTFSRFDAQGRPVENKGYTRLDVSWSYRLNEWASLFGRIENLLNQEYQEVLGYPAYRLNFSAGVRFRVGGGR